MLFVELSAGSASQAHRGEVQVQHRWSAMHAYGAYEWWTRNVTIPADMRYDAVRSGHLRRQLAVLEVLELACQLGAKLPPMQATIVVHQLQRREHHCRCT